MAEETTTTTSTPRPTTVTEANKPILDIKGEQALMGAATTDPATGEAIPAATAGEYLGAAEYVPDDLTAGADEFLEAKTYDPLTGELITDRTLDADDLDITAETATKATDITAPVRDADDSYTIDAIDLANTSYEDPNFPSMTAQTGTIIENGDELINVDDVIDERTKATMLSDGTLAETKTQDLAQEATTKYQLEQIMASLDSGAELPPWASPAVRKVKAMMNQRGLGASSMAAAAMVQALMESSIPIANADAQRYATIQIQNLNNEQQTALANAATIASLDMKNLDNKMQAAKHNATSFLQMSLQNLTNKQATEVLTFQTKVQSLFTDTAAENARLQFNAKSEAQVDQYYATLGATVANNNANRTVAINEFNADQTNSIKKYNAKLEDAREKFNTNLQMLIDQSNTVWRRNINTANTASQNAANKYNAQAILGLSVDAQNSLWQKYRDEAHMAYQTAQNAQQRAHAIAITALASQFSMDLFGASLDADSEQRTSKFLGRVLDAVITTGLKAFSFSSSGSTSELNADTSGEYDWLENLDNTQIDWDDDQTAEEPYDPYWWDDPDSAESFP